MPPVPARSGTAALTAEVLALIDRPGPRYTSYPTADRFHAQVGAQEYELALAQRAAATSPLPGGPLGVYIHLPFCESVCYYCACNKVVTRQHGRAAEYLLHLEKELSLHAQVMGYRTPIASLHLGGGTPTFLSDEELARLMKLVREHFTFTSTAELAIEVDPRTVSPERLSLLHSMGFNRVSLGVQDFDPEVQKAVHRVQAFEQVAALTERAQLLGFDSINLDLIYGLPKQSEQSLRRTLEQVAKLRPSRLAFYAYAHLPARFKPQRRIASEDLPSATQRLAMLEMAIGFLLEQDYVYIGMDHFALPDDELAVAKRQGRLHRNFQGYTAMPDVDLIGLGASSIGRVGHLYVQNLKEVPAYEQALARGEFAIERGYALSRDDLLRRSVITALMCQGRVAFESIELAHLVDFKAYFGKELQALRRWQDLGLLDVEPDAISLTELGWWGVRAIAMEFDRHLRHQADQGRYSRIA